MTDVEAGPAGLPGPAFQRSLTLLLGAIAVVGTADMALDAPASWRDPHILLEATFLGLCLATAAWLARGWTREHRSLARLQASLASRQAERDVWRDRARALLRGLGEVIDAQMTAWQLTPAERDTALMLLKGYSHRQIADLAGRSERTVRQHAVAVYRKSGLGGRAELSAYFLEDLLLPSAATPAD